MRGTASQAGRVLRDDPRDAEHRFVEAHDTNGDGVGVCGAHDAIAKDVPDRPALAVLKHGPYVGDDRAEEI
jgi:hypothetical protein